MSDTKLPPLNVNLAYSDYLAAFALTCSQRLNMDMLIHVHSVTAAALGAQDAGEQNRQVRSFIAFVAKLKDLEDGYNSTT